MNGKAYWALFACMVLAASCSRRERTDPEAEEWQEIQALANDAVVVPATTAEGIEHPEVAGEPVPDDEFTSFARTLRKMKSVERAAGETLLTGESLVFDHERRYVRMDGDVKVVDDHGIMESASLTARVSSSNEVEYIEAKGGVNVTSGERTAHAEQAVYNHSNGFLQLEGQASATEEGNKLSGEQIGLWLRGSRKMVCEPNALLQIHGKVGLPFEGLGSGSGESTEIRASRIVYDESKRLVELSGNVRLRDPRVAMNCENVRLYLKDGNEIDWIEASSEIIIQADEGKALADRATYYADEGKFTLEGEPKVMQGQYILTGDRILFWHETQRMVCEPHARALLYLDAATRAKFLKDLND